MKKIQNLYNQIQKSKKEKKELFDIYKQELIESSKYQELLENLRELRAEKKQVELSIKEDLIDEFGKIETLKLDIQNDELNLSDLVLEKLINSEEVVIYNKNNKRVETIFAVKLK